MNIPTGIIDAHHHLWDLKHCYYPWLMETGVKRFFGDPAPIQKDYLPADFQEDIGDLPVQKSVHIQVGVDPGDAIKETRWLQTLANENGLPHAIVAFADITRADLERQLDAHGEAENLRGIRQIVGRSAREDAQTGTASLLENPDFLSGAKQLVERGLSFDLQLTPPLMGKAAATFGAVDGLKIALCHAGSPSDFSEDGQAQWLGGLEQLASIPGMICKISGFGMFDHDWTVDSIREYVLRVIDIFGPDRVAFGSNFPVDKLYASYSLVFGAYLDITDDFSDNERQAMFHDNAADFYRI